MEGLDNFSGLPLSTTIYYNDNEANIFIDTSGSKFQSPTALPISSSRWCTSLPGQLPPSFGPGLESQCQPYYNMPSVPQFNSMSHTYPNPERVEDVPASKPAWQPPIQPPAKTESKSPYKNAPPSVISVRQRNKQDCFFKPTFWLEFWRS